MRPNPNTRVRAALLQTLEREGARLAEAWPDARKGSAEALRRSRIATRRLRQVLAVAGRVTAERRADVAARDLRAIAKTLGPLRDLAMASDFLVEYEDRGDIGMVAREVKTVLDRDRDHVFKEAHLAARRLPVGRIGRRLAAIRKEIAAAAESAPWARTLTMAMARRVADVAEAAERSSALYEPERLHAMRIAIKKLRYAVELAAEASLVPRSLPLRLARHQKRLGAWHDRVAVVHLLRQRQAAPSLPSSSSWSRLADLLDREAHVLHGQVRRGWQNLDQCLADLRLRIAGVALDQRPRPMRAALTRREPRGAKVGRSG